MTGIIFFRIMFSLFASFSYSKDNLKTFNRNPILSYHKLYARFILPSENNLKPWTIKNTRSEYSLLSLDILGFCRQITTRSIFVSQCVTNDFLKINYLPLNMGSIKCTRVSVVIGIWN